MNKLNFYSPWMFWFFLIPTILAFFDNRMFVFSIAFFVFEIWRKIAHWYGAEWLPIPQQIADDMLKLVHVNKKDTVYDLGSGDGRIVMSAAKLGAKSIGIEIDPLRVLISKIKIRLSGLDAKIIQDNFFKVDFKDATVITIFLLPRTMEKLKNKLKGLKKGTRIVSHRYVFKNWRPAKVEKNKQIYLYKV